MNWQPASDITSRIHFLVKNLDLDFINPDYIYCFRSTGSSGRAIARIWSLPTIWQLALNVPGGYCLEVISEKFDKQTLEQQEHTLIHELLHIPHTFSGALVPHRTAKHRTYRHYHDTVETLFRSLSKRSYE